MDVLCETEVSRRVGAGGIYGDGEIEDDVFYAELVRQVLILTAEDDDDSSSGVISRGSRDNFGYLDSLSRPAAATTAGSLWNGSTDSVPTWPAAVNVSRTGGGFGGTGVFIPQTAGKSRRRNGNGRRGNGSHKQQAQKMVQNKY